MVRTLGFAGLVAAALLLLTPDGVLGQKKKDAGDDKGEKATAQEHAALLGYKQIAGSIFYVDPGAKTVTLRIEVPAPQNNNNQANNNNNNNVNNPNNLYRPRPGFNINNRNNNANQVMQWNRAMQQYQQAMKSKNPAQAQQAMMQIERLEMQMMMQQGQQMQRMQQQMVQQVMRNANNPNGNKIATISKDFDLEYVENVPVRKTFLATEYDDMGNLKKYTKEQLAELRGKDASKPGYMAKFDDLTPGQEVTLYLARPTKKKDDDDKTAADRPVVTMIVMTKEIPSGMQGADPKKKKK